MDPGASQYEKLLTQCKSNDVDAKVDALTKLQAYLESGSPEFQDPDALISILKASLRTSNLHLTNATLSALPAILPHIITRPSNAFVRSSTPVQNSSSTSSVSPSGTIDSSALRSALVAFLPPGGVIDRLGDKEKAQAKARETLVILGGYAFRVGGTNPLSKSGKGIEPPIAIFERFIKEGGLASKVWKVREQSILTLVHIRRSHHLFPIRPYATLLVDCLEDTDPHVRDCARVSVVELFSGPGVTDAARADLKKEMTKKGVRKTIVESVLSKLLSSSTASNTLPSNEESGDGDALNGKKEYIPPSLALQGKRPRVASQNASMSRSVSSTSVKEVSRPPSRANVASPQPPQTPISESSEIQPVYIASARDLENEFAAMLKPFDGKETEHNWAIRDQAIQRVRGMLQGEVHVRYQEQFLAGLKDNFIMWSTKTLASLRTTVALNTCSLYSELAIALGPLLDPHCEVLLTNLLKMAGFTKKITAQQSQVTVGTIITYTSPQPRLVIPLLWNSLQEKTLQSRAFVVGHLKHYLETHGTRSKAAIDANNLTETLEKSLKKALADPSPAVRETARLLYWVFHEIWPERAQTIIETLDATARKQVEKVCPIPGGQAALPPTTPKVTKKSSVAAAIAASRAKAKAIATAPPSLRHQATSSSHAAAAPRRETSPNASTRSPPARPGSPLRTSTSPPSVNRRVVSASISRTTSAPVVNSASHSRTSSSVSEKMARGPSPSLVDQDSKRRRLSSPLTGGIPGSGSRNSLSNNVLTAAQQSSTKPPVPVALGHLTQTVHEGTKKHSRQSLSRIFGHDDDELLTAQTVPIPEDSDSDNSVNLMSFSHSLHAQTPAKSPPHSIKTQTMSPVSDHHPTGSVSNALSSGSLSDMVTNQMPIVEDALRARAEQAESAAERLLELVEPEDDPMNSHPSIPSSLLKSGNGPVQPNTKPKTKPTPLPVIRGKPVPVTPNHRASVVMRQAALFADSPARGPQPSLLDVLQTQKQDNGWWLKRKILFSQVAPTKSASSAQEMDNLISQLDNGDADVPALQRLAVICMENAVAEPNSPFMSNGSHPSSPSPTVARSFPALHVDIWEKNKTFERLFISLMKYLEPTRTEDELSYGLIVVWEMLEGQSTYLEGKEGDIFSMILRVRYCNKLNVLEGTNAIRDTLTSKIDPVYGLTTMHASLRVFHSEPTPVADSEEVKAATYAFGLMALGKFILRLPAEIAEEELPRLKATLIHSLNDKTSLIVRESAAAAIIAAQLVLRDETHLFALLDGLADDKKNLLTYLFDKHGARGSGLNGATGMDKLEKEIRRLDTRTSTPLRSAQGS
ncbi:Protein STU1 [Psilocybe cubensis]|uniref:TOG domain-containing protein n=2 Tax=Psilocybe cubensis TaxID=181762 RepID=A0A8H7Y1Q7_PSICU|nr:Protein STU1 [Psilocybe cubensis]KAH9482989.1 Protein STU1 [Psilocybe cubensis]